MPRIVLCQNCKLEPWTVFWECEDLPRGPKYLCERCAEMEQWHPTREVPELICTENDDVLDGIAKIRYLKRVRVND